MNLICSSSELSNIDNGIESRLKTEKKKKKLQASLQKKNTSFLFSSSSRQNYTLISITSVEFIPNFEGILDFL